MAPVRSDRLSHHPRLTGSRVESVGSSRHHGEAALSLKSFLCSNMTGTQLYFTQLCLNTCGVQEHINSRLVYMSPCPVLLAVPVKASAQPHPLLLAHVGAHKEGFQLAFPLHVD